MNNNIEELRKEAEQIKEKLKELKHKFVENQIQIDSYKEEEEKLAVRLDELESMEEEIKRKSAEQAIKSKGIEHKRISYSEHKKKPDDSGYITIKGNYVLYLVIAILVALLLVSVLTGGFNIKKTYSAQPISGQTISEQDASLKALTYINNLLASQGQKAELSGAEDNGLLYKLKLNVGGQSYDMYMTKDGKLLFLNAVDLTQSQQPGATPPSTASTASASERVNVSSDDDPSIGPGNAEVTIIEFSDYQCPFCERAEPTVKQILETYNGQVRLVYRDFPLSFHPYAQKAAEASECADEQGKFWEYHDKLFANQNALDTDSLKRYAKDLGLDTTKFNSCLDSGKMASEVAKDFSDGQSAGVSGTPAFFINGISLVGAQPFSEFQKIIDKELSNT